MSGDFFRTHDAVATAWFERAVTSSPFPIMLHAEGEVVFINDAWVAITGYSRADIPTIEAWTARAYGAGAPEVRRVIEELYTETSSRADGGFEIKTADGRTRMWDFESIVLGKLPDGRSLAMSTAHDVTERKDAQTEAALKESRLSAVMDNAPFGAHLYELSDDGRLVLVGYNQRASQMLGIDHEALVGLTLEEAFPGNIGTETPEAYRRVAREGITWEADQFAYDAAGISGVFDVIAFPFGPNRATVFFRDVTDKRRLETALEASEIRYKRLFDSVQEGFAYYRIIRDEAGQAVDWRILDVNAGFGKLSGLQDVVGKTMLEVAPNYRDSSATIFDAGIRVAESGVPEELDALSRIGRWTHFFLSSPEQDHVVFIGEDIHDRVLAEAALARSTRALRALSGVNAALVRAKTEDELLGNVCDVITLSGEYPLAWVGYAVGGPDMTVKPMSWAGVSSEYAADLWIEWGDSEHGRGPTGRCIREVKPIVMREMDSDPSYAPWREVAAAHGFRSSLNLPLLCEDGDILGALVIYSTDIEAFGEDEVELLTEMAEDLSYGIETLRTRAVRTAVEADLLVTNGRLEVILRDITETMGRVVEARDPYTQGHQVGVAKLGRLIGTEMGLSADDINAIEITSLVHDIGKLSIPAEILTKPGKLSDTEFAIIKSHSLKGYEILRAIDFGWPVAETVLQHHERLDGSGYPNSLSGDEISMAARVVAVADVIEAMASHRPYRAALGLEPAIREIREHPEKFDADVIAACMRLYESGRMVVGTDGTGV